MSVAQEAAGAKRLLMGIKNHYILDPALARASAIGKGALGAKMRRVVVLDMTKSKHVKLWQILHNNPEKFTILNEKESAQQTKYFSRIIFEELSDGELPTTRTIEDFENLYL